MMRALFVVSVGTLASRLLGFARDAIFAALFGAGVVADAFLLAFQLVTVIRRLLTEGALNAALVPAWLAARRDGDETAALFAGRVVTAIGGGVVILAIVLAVAMPWLLAVLAPGFTGTDAMSLAISHARIMLPYLAFAGPAAVLIAILNAQGRVAFSAFAPVLFNATLIACALALMIVDVGGERAALVLAVAVGIAGVLQLAMLAGGGVSLRWTRPRLDPAMRDIFQRALPGMIANAAPQLLIVIAAIAASQETSSVSRLYFASRLIDLPLGLVAAAASAIVLPRLASGSRHDDDGALTMLAFALPAAMGLVLLAEPIVAVVFERGAFDPADRAATAQALRWLASGLPALALSKAWMARCFARYDGRTPLLAALASFAVAGIGSAVAGDLAGIAGSVAAGGWAMATTLFVSQRPRVSLIDAVWIAVPTLAMAAVLIAAQRIWPDPSGSTRILWLAALIALGIAVNALTLAPWLLRLRRRAVHGKGPPHQG